MRAALRTWRVGVVGLVDDFVFTVGDANQDDAPVGDGSADNVERGVGDDQRLVGAEGGMVAAEGGDARDLDAGVGIVGVDDDAARLDDGAGVGCPGGGGCPRFLARRRKREASRSYAIRPRRRLAPLLRKFPSPGLDSLKNRRF